MKQMARKIVVWILTREAQLVLKKYRPQIIAVTGSVGKTSTKDAIYTALASSVFVRKNTKSFNSELGVPLTILGLDTGWGSPWKWLHNVGRGLALVLFPTHYPKWLVLEVGLDRPGDIENIARWLRPNIAVFTRLPDTPVHVEFFPDVKSLHKEKKSLAKYVEKGGTLVINADDPNLSGLTSTPGVHAITYGFSEDAHVRGTNEGILDTNGIEGVHMKVETGGSSVPVMLRGVLGRQHLYPVLAAFAVGVGVDLNTVTLANGFREHEHAPGRMRIIDGVRGSVIIDDSYNASPVAVEAALETLEKLTVPGRRIAILGDMAELGSLSSEAHTQIGTRAAAVLDVFIGVGKEMHTAVRAARKAGMSDERALHMEYARNAAEHVANDIGSGDVVLVKGSQSMRTERAVELLMARPEQKAKLLVRQERAWKER